MNTPIATVEAMVRTWFQKVQSRQVGLVSHIGAGDAVKRRCPAFWPFPGRKAFRRVTRDRSCGDAARPEARVDAGAGLSTSADDENRTL
jgi:hypothetical protein